MQNLGASSDFAFFTDLVDSLYALPQAKNFRQPVFDLWSDEALPGYRESIETPMDLGTVKSRLKDGYYDVFRGRRRELDENSVMHDIELTFRNCMEYNMEGSAVFLEAKGLLHRAQIEFDERDLQRQRDEAERRQIEERRVAKSAERKRLSRQQQRERERRQEKRKAKKTTIMEVPVKRLRVSRTKPSYSIAQASAGCDKSVHSPSESKEGHIENNENPHVPNGAKREEKQLVECAHGELGSGEILITFVPLKGLRRKSGKKSAIARKLEEKHIQLMFHRRRIVEFKFDLERRTHVLMTPQEKEVLCEKIAGLNFRQMLSVLRILAHGMNRPELLNANEVDIPVENVDNRTLREIQMNIDYPVEARIQDSLGRIESVLKDIEVEYVKVRYQSVV